MPGFFVSDAHLWVVNFLVAIRANQLALPRFDGDLLPSSVGKRPKVELKLFLQTILVVKLQGSVVSPVATQAATPTHHLYEPYFPS